MPNLGELRGRLKAANIYASTNGLEISGPGQRHFLNWHVIWQSSSHLTTNVTVWQKMSQFDNKCHNLTFPQATNVIIWHQMSYSDIKCYNLTFHLTSDFIYWQQMSYSNMKFKCHFLKLNTIIWLSIWQVMQSNIRCHHFYPTLSQVRSV